jgi:hypothetical protein
MSQEHHIQYWNSEEYKPSLCDTLRTLRLCLSLLADSLPLALKGLETASHEAQLDFWRALICLDEETDFASKHLPDGSAEKWVESLNDFYSIAEELFHQHDDKEMLKDSVEEREG